MEESIFAHLKNISVFLAAMWKKNPNHQPYRKQANSNTTNYFLLQAVNKREGVEGLWL